MDELGGKCVSLRLFVAVHLAQEPFDEVVRCIEALKAELGYLPIKWIKPSQVHVTVAFYGSIDPEALPELGNALENITRYPFVKPFELSLQGTGRFGPSGRGRVCWIGLGGDFERFSRIAGIVEGAGEPFSTRRERRTFNPHITIARCEKLSREDNERVKTAFARVSVRPLSWRVESFQLMRSHLKPTGAEYEILRSFILQSN